MVRFKRKYDAKWSGRLGAGTASHCSDKWNWQRLGYCDTKQRVLIMKSAYLMLKLYSPHGACQRPFIITSEGPGYNIKHSYEFITPRPRCSTATRHLKCLSHAGLRTQNKMHICLYNWRNFLYSILPNNAFIIIWIARAPRNWLVFCKCKNIEANVTDECMIIPYCCLIVWWALVADDAWSGGAKWPHGDVLLPPHPHWYLSGGH